MLRKQIPRTNDIIACSKACILENESEDRFEGSTEQLLRGLWSCQIL
jgi:hypothetical protein